MIRNYHSSGQRCTHWHTLLIASSAGVLPQTIALIGVKHCILWIRSIGVNPTDRHQPQTRWVTILVMIFFHIPIYPDVTYGNWVMSGPLFPMWMCLWGYEHTWLQASSLTPERKWVALSTKQIASSSHKVDRQSNWRQGQESAPSG